MVSPLCCPRGARHARPLRQVGDVKFGDLKGEDAHGNKYYENKEYPYGEDTHKKANCVVGEKVAR